MEGIDFLNEYAIDVLSQPAAMEPDDDAIQPHSAINLLPRAAAVTLSSNNDRSHVLADFGELTRYRFGLSRTLIK